MRRSLTIAALALLPNLTLAQTPSVLAPRILGTGAGTVAAGTTTAGLAAEIARALAAEGALVTPAQLAAALSSLPDGTTLTMVNGHLSIIGQVPTAASTVPALSNLNVLLADGTYLTGPVLQALLNISTSGSGTSTPSPTPTPTPTATTSDGTLSGLPSTIVAGQPLSAVTFTPPQTVVYFVLYDVASAAEEGQRWPSSAMGGNLTLLIPQTANAYTVRAYSAATGGTVAYESAQIAVTAAPGPLPATPVQTADSGATSSSVTMNWSATATSYLVLGRAGVGLAYGSLADASISTNSYTFTGLAASSAPRAAIIPQNADGYGTPSGQFVSYTTAAASATPALTLTNPVFAASPVSAFGQQLVGGSGTSSAALVLPSGPVTYEFWFSASGTPPADYNSLVDINIGAAGGNNQLVHLRGDGTLQAFSGAYNIHSPTVLDGNRHFVEVDSAGDSNVGLHFYVDGVYAGQVGGTAETANPTIAVRAGGFGQIDELRISTGLRHPNGTTYAVPTAPLTVDGTTVALYHLDGNGVSQ